ncbi:hypothetical protein C8J57DRAFT_1429588 [Mycena rebaudengoi]|nr:hypothetical protein C8J57DRAFT_1429588 [Mycena rebaudengoi]
MSAPSISTTGSRSRPQARKKINDDGAYFGPQPVAAGAKRHATDKVEGEPRVEFIKMPTPVLYRYLNQFDLVPLVYPSPLLANDPPPPSSLDNPLRQISRAPSPPPTTPANRPRRESKDHTRRRSSRLVEEDAPSRMPILADIEELHAVLAGIAERHFRELGSINVREEVDTLASFMCAVEKAKGGKNKL